MSASASWAKSPSSTRGRRTRCPTASRDRAVTPMSGRGGRAAGSPSPPTSPGAEPTVTDREGSRKRLFGRWGASRSLSGARDSGPTVEELRILTRQFYVTLQAFKARVEENPQLKERPAFKRVDVLLKKDPDAVDAASKFTWSDAYEVEQLLVLLFDEPGLKIELGSRIVEARRELGHDVAEWFSTQVANADTETLRVLLARLVNDLQWYYTVEEAKRGYSKEIARHTGNIFVVASLAFAGLLLTPALGAFLSGRSNKLFLLPIAGLAGAWGASFSMLTSMRRRLARSNLNNLKVLRAFWIVI